MMYKKETRREHLWLLACFLSVNSTVDFVIKQLTKHRLIKSQINFEKYIKEGGKVSIR